jgi:hypothetical protein
MQFGSTCIYVWCLLALSCVPHSIWLFVSGHLDWHAAWDTSPNCCASVHNIKD